MSSFKSVDPGVVDLGWARWNSGELVACGLSSAKSKSLSDRVAEHVCNVCKGENIRVVCERMVTRGKFSIVDAQDLIDVNLVAGAVGTDWVTPSEWKGNVPHLVEQARTWYELRPCERELMPKLPKSGKGNASHVWSAVGIGLHVLGRAHRGKKSAA